MERAHAFANTLHPGRLAHSCAMRKGSVRSFHVEHAHAIRGRALRHGPSTGANHGAPADGSLTGPRRPANTLLHPVVPRGTRSRIHEHGPLDERSRAPCESRCLKAAGFTDAFHVEHGYASTRHFSEAPGLRIAFLPAATSPPPQDVPRGTPACFLDPTQVSASRGSRALGLEGGGSTRPFHVEHAFSSPSALNLGAIPHGARTTVPRGGGSTPDVPRGTRLRGHMLHRQQRAPAR